MIQGRIIEFVSYQIIFFVELFHVIAFIILNHIALKNLIYSHLISFRKWVFQENILFGNSSSSDELKSESQTLPH